MALIKCPECGNQVSDTARNCPHCGYQLKENNYKQSPIYKTINEWLTVIVVAIIVVAIAALIINTMSEKNTVNPRDYSPTLIGQNISDSVE